jgi:L-alanine-DL-glutamate epimerase-like enolase superfamily enzyme
MKIDIQLETWPLARPFRITGQTYTTIEVVVAVVRDGSFEGRGEAAGVDYLGETSASLAQQIAGVRPEFAAGVTRAHLQTMLPIGGARNALDCALWDLEGARSGSPAWRRADGPKPEPVATVWTIGADAPHDVARQAAQYIDARAIKLKLTGDGLDGERIRAARAARPDVWLGVDGNQGFTCASLSALMPVLVGAGVELIEQPLAIGRDADLELLRSPIALAADESVQGVASIAELSAAYSMINIKLDKCGGLTEALEMVSAARARGMKIMVGNMLGTSLAMAPAFLVAQSCDVVDLDGPLLLQRDRQPSADYSGGTIWCAEEIWGGAGDAPRASTN